MAAEGLKNVSRVSDMPPDVPSTQRISLAGNIPPDWLDRLLVAHCAIQPGAPLDEAATTLLAVVHDIFEDAAIGVRIPDQDGQPLIVRRSERSSQVASHDGGRLFPELEVEILITIPGDHSPTLHIATNDKTRFVEEGPPRLFADRVAQVFGAVIRASRAHERSQALEIHRMREQMIRLERLGSLGQMVAGIVHELNNPLTSIVAYADFLQKRTDDVADIERLLRISEAARRIRSFSRDLTEYASPRTAVPSAVSIDKVIDQALRFCDHELDQASVVVKRSFGSVLPVRGVQNQLVQVFVNLFRTPRTRCRARAGCSASPPRWGQLTAWR